MRCDRGRLQVRDANIVLRKLNRLELARSSIFQCLVRPPARLLIAAGRQIKGGEMGVRGAFFGRALKMAGGGLSGALLAALSPVAMAQTAGNTAGTGGFTPMLNTYCSKCHNSEDWAGGLAF